MRRWLLALPACLALWLLVRRDLPPLLTDTVDGYDYWVASRGGLYVFGRDGGEGRSALVLNARAFGMASAFSRLYLFRYVADDESGKNLPTDRGEILSLQTSGGRLRGLRREAAGLDNGVHHILVHNTTLLALETYHQRIALFRIDEETGSLHDRGRVQIEPHGVSAQYVRNGMAHREADLPHYVHANALAVSGDELHVMCPALRNRLVAGEARNAATARSLLRTYSLPLLLRKGELRLLREVEIAGSFCHDLEPLAGGRLITLAASNEALVLAKDGSVVQRQPLQPTVSSGIADQRALCRGFGLSGRGEALVGTNLPSTRLVLLPFPFRGSPSGAVNFSFPHAPCTILPIRDPGAEPPDEL